MNIGIKKEIKIQYKIKENFLPQRSQRPLSVERVYTKLHCGNDEFVIRNVLTRRREYGTYQIGRAHV